MGDDHPTPGWLRRVFDGWFDPCPLRQSIVGFDGLEINWPDPTFANIPYSKPLPWVEKAITEARKGTRVVLLVRVDPSTKWWLKLVAHGARFAFFHGRLNFEPEMPLFPEDTPKGGGHFPYASALVFL